MKIKLDFICASIDKTEYLIEFLIGFNKIKNHPNFEINLILVDQHHTNRENILKEIYPQIIYIHSERKGLSLNRNIGLSKSKSKFYSFIDSDCSIDENYFNVLNKIIKKECPNNEDISIFGKIQSKEDKKDILKRWPSKTKKLKHIDIWRLSTSVNIVYNCKKIEFDEDLGIGARFGSCEDIDYSLRAKGKKIYNPNLITYHPKQSFHQSDNEKIKSYGLGFGALCKKNLSFLSICIMTAGIAKKIIDPFLGKAKFNQSLISIKARILGFILYEKN